MLRSMGHSRSPTGGCSSYRILQVALPWSRYVGIYDRPLMLDYNNSRIMDFQTVEKFTSNALAIQDAARMRQFL